MGGGDARPVGDEEAELRASRERLVLAADAEHREIERELHGVVQQHFVALGVNLQLAAQAVDTDPSAAKELLASMGRDVREAIADTARLAERIHPSLLEADLAVALRSALASAAIPVTIDVARSTYPRHVALTVYRVCLAALAGAEGVARAAVEVRDEAGRLDVDVELSGARGTPELGGLVDRVQALGGGLTISSCPGGARVRASLPVPR
jgi:signal transduction histidine kinase